ncbi:MAG: carbohydrate ABC transporter permease [Clostridia bacterium]|nr:carbohydrate ABC transporter permease [Clostridia bacterium]MBQ9996785.1 carbohydrate ABC transporter permease [Clostridia bacterium]
MFALVVLVTFAFLFLFPTVFTVTNSFMSTTEISANYGKIFTGLGISGDGGRVFIADKVNLQLIPDRVSFSQYATVLLKSPEYLLKFWNSVIYVLPIVLFQLVVAAGASYCFARVETKFRSIVFFAYIILMLMPYQVTLVPNYIVMDKLSLMNTRWAIILPGIFSPFSVFILTKFMRRIPTAVVEAAKLDGASEWQIFSLIYMPLCRSTLYSVAILVFIDYWNMVEQPLILLTDQELYPLSVFLSKINEGDTGIALAIAVIYMVPPVLLFLYSEDYLVDGIAYSASVKG